MNGQDEKVIIKTGITFTNALQIAFVILKLCNIINWNWFWVLFPTIISVGIGILYIIVCIIIILM